MNELIDKIEEMIGMVFVPLRDGRPVEESNDRQLKQLLDQAANLLVGTDMIPKRLAELITPLEVDGIGARGRYSGDAGRQVCLCAK